MTGTPDDQAELQILTRELFAHPDGEDVRDIQTIDDDDTDAQETVRNLFRPLTDTEGAPHARH